VNRFQSTGAGGGTLALRSSFGWRQLPDGGIERYVGNGEDGQRRRRARYGGLYDPLSPIPPGDEFHGQRRPRSSSRAARRSSTRNSSKDIVVEWNSDGQDGSGMGVFGAPVLRPAPARRGIAGAAAAPLTTCLRWGASASLQIKNDARRHGKISSSGSCPQGRPPSINRCLGDPATTPRPTCFGVVRHDRRRTGDGQTQRRSTRAFPTGSARIPKDLPPLTMTRPGAKTGVSGATFKTRRPSGKRKLGITARRRPFR
jgi:hypothetical protein